MTTTAKSRIFWTRKITDIADISYFWSVQIKRDFAVPVKPRPTHFVKYRWNLNYQLVVYKDAHETSEHDRTLKTHTRNEMVTSYEQ